MEYRYPPLYKYIAFFIILFLFLRHYKHLSQDKYLIVSILVTLLVVLLDYMLIFDHPNILQVKESFDTDDLDDILDDIKNYDNDYTNKINIKPSKINSKQFHCKQCPKISKLPIFRPIYDDSNDGNSELEMKNMMDMQNMQYYSRYPSMHSDIQDQYY